MAKSANPIYRYTHFMLWHQYIRAACLMILVTFITSASHAQVEPGFSLNQFEPSERGSDWFTGESLDLRGHEKFAIGLVGDWAYQPLVAYDQNGNIRGNLVKNQFFTHLGASVVLWNRVRFGLNVPVLLFSNGDSFAVNSVTLAAPQGAALGDIRLGADVGLVGHYGDSFHLAFGLQVHLPSGNQEKFTSDGSTQLKPRALFAGDIGIFAYSATTGFLFRTSDSDYLGEPVGSEWQFGGTVGLRLFDRTLLIGPEFWGATVISDLKPAFLSQAGTPFEALIGAHYRPSPAWNFGLGVGPGFTRGLGSPTSRVVFSAEYLPIQKKKQTDRDLDGIVDELDHCPNLPGEASKDEPKRHGCPPADSDKDGILDSQDACKTDFGQANEDPKLNGCPYCIDSDEDGIINAKDACPTEPGLSRLDDPERHGCPDIDEDEDGIVDQVDACPRKPGLAHEDPARHGCPIARIEGTDIIIVDRIEFDSRSANIRKDSEPILRAVLLILQEHPELERIMIEGHTDNIGSRKYNQELSQKRARAVLLWLEAEKIEKKRLNSRGVGMKRPIDTNETATGRQNNRRVEFHIQQQEEKEDSE